MVYRLLISTNISRAKQRPIVGRSENTTQMYLEIHTHTHVRTYIVNNKDRTKEQFGYTWWQIYVCVCTYVYVYIAYAVLILVLCVIVRQVNCYSQYYRRDVLQTCWYNTYLLTEQYSCNGTACNIPSTNYSYNGWHVYTVQGRYSASIVAGVSLVVMYMWLHCIVCCIMIMIIWQ